MEIQPLDIAVAALIAAAALRGLFIGLVRESFSLGALAGAYTAVQFFTPPVATWLEETTQGEVGPAISPWLAGAGIALGTLVGVILVGRVLRRALQAAGLGWADRCAGGLLGTAEGILVTGILLALGTEFLGRDHIAFRDTVSLSAFEEFERISEESEIDIDVAAPPRTF